MLGGKALFDYLDYLDWIIPIVVIVYIIIIILKNIIDYIKDEKAPIIEIRAQLIFKEVNACITSIGKMDIDNNTYILIFKLDTGNDMKLYVSNKVFNNITETKYGTLKFKGTRFLSFITDDGVVVSK